MMTHQELIIELSHRLKWPEKRVAEVLEAAVVTMNGRLSEQSRLTMPGLGDFATRKRTEYISVNPETNERYLIPPAVELLFEVDAELKEKLKSKLIQ